MLDLGHEKKRRALHLDANQTFDLIQGQNRKFFNNNLQIKSKRTTFPAAGVKILSGLVAAPLRLVRALGIIFTPAAGKVVLFDLIWCFCHRIKSKEPPSLQRR